MPLRLRPDVATADTDEGVVLLDGREGRYWQLNRTGAAILRHLLDDRDPDQIAGELATRYGVDRRRARDDVAAITSQLHATGLVEDT